MWKHGQMKKKLNPLRTERRVLLCSSRGSYRHLVAECPDSWENMKKRNTSGGDANSGSLSKRNNIMCILLGVRIMTELIDGICVEEVAEVFKLQQELQDLRDDIIEIMRKKQRRKGEILLGNFVDLEKRQEDQTWVTKNSLHRDSRFKNKR